MLAVDHSLPEKTICVKTKNLSSMQDNNYMSKAQTLLVCIDVSALASDSCHFARYHLHQSI